MSSAGPLRGCEVLSPMLTPEEITSKEGQDRWREPQAAQGRRKPRGKYRGGQGGNRFAMLNAFVDTAMATLRPTDALVWLVLYRDAHGGTAKTSQAYIARRAGVCLRTVGMSIRRLEGAGLVYVLHRGGLNRGLSIHRLLDPATCANLARCHAQTTDKTGAITVAHYP